MRQEIFGCKILYFTSSKQWTWANWFWYNKFTWFKNWFSFHWLLCRLETGLKYQLPPNSLLKLNLTTICPFYSIRFHCTCFSCFVWVLFEVKASDFMKGSWKQQTLNLMLACLLASQPANNKSNYAKSEYEHLTLVHQALEQEILILIVKNIIELHF